jgi:hypothetical protein
MDDYGTCNTSDYASGNTGSDDLRWYKFCLPKAVYTYGDPDLAANGWTAGEFVDMVSYPKTSNNKFTPVYIQTLDKDRLDIPYLAIVGAGSNYATAVNLADAITTLGKCSSRYHSTNVNSLFWNIYTIDYAEIDIVQVTSWIFGGEQPSPTEWVPLKNAVGESPCTVCPDVTGTTTTTFNTKGYLTDFKIPGVTFINESKLTPNHGILDGILEAPELFFKYEGTEMIGSTYHKVPIYYYRIGIIHPSVPDTVWLTDSYGKTGNYLYQFPGGPYQIGFFGDLLTTNLTGTTYDKDFLQTLGLRYINAATMKPADGTIPDQTFVVVANANYTDAKPDKYRYLAAVNNHLVFLEGISNAMVFQYGKVDNGYTGIEVVGSGGIFGIPGGIRLLNQVGNVVDFYSVDGRLLKSVQVTSADQTVVAPRGVVIVKSAGRATKVVVN